MKRLLVAAAVLLVAGVWDGARVYAQAQAAPPPAEGDVPTAPVAIDGTVLFHVRGASSYPAAARADVIAGRIAALAADRSVAPESVTAVDGEGVSRLAAGDRVIMTVADADAALEALSRQNLAAIHAARIQKAIADYRVARSRPSVVRAAQRTGVATAVLLAAMLVLLWFWGRIDRGLRHRLEARIHTVGIQSFEVVRAEQIRAGLQSILRGIRLLIHLALLLMWAGFVLSQWPWTRGMSQGVTGLVLGPLSTLGAGFVANIPRFAFLAILFALVRIALRLLRMFFESVETGGVSLANFDREWAQPTYKIVRIAVVALGLIVAYPYIPGSESEAFKGVSLFIGIVFSLGSSTAIANIIAGYMMTYRRAFRLGDRVKIGDNIGEVIEMRLQVTHIRTYRNEEVVIPNSQILGGEVVNYSSLSRDRGVLINAEVGIGYETPWRQVEAMLLKAAARTSGLGEKPAPFVLVRRLGDFAVVYELNAPCGDIRSYLAQVTALNHNVLDVFNEYGVQIMTPAYEGDPAQPKLVPPAEWFTAPAAVPAERV